MADLARIKLNGTTYNFKDAWAREIIENLEFDNMISTTWANLVDLRDNSELQPGCFYRIIDYNFISSKLNVHSGNHQFDIIVLAISESMLSETAYAAKHAGDTYFQREIMSDGIEWLYTMYVDDYANDYGQGMIDHADDIHAADIFCDSDYLEHPETGDDVPVLYKTNSEEYDFDDPDYDDIYFYEGTYDLDGDEFDLWSKWEYDWENGNGELTFKQQYALTPIVVENNQLVVSPIPESKFVPVNLNAWELKYCLDNDKALFDWADTNGKGVIYYMKDEFGNEAPYDFKNVMFERRKITSTSNNSILSGLINKYYGIFGMYNITSDANDTQYLYTFGDPNTNATTDGSLFGACAYNVIKPYIQEGQKLINNIICAGGNNYIANNCFDMTLFSCSNLNIGFYCSLNLIANTSQFVLDASCRSNVFFGGSACTFGRNCNQNIAQNLDSCKIGYLCSNNNFGSSCSGSVFGNACSNLIFGNWCYGNTFGNNVTNSTFNSYFSYNIVIGWVNNLKITAPYVRYCTFEAKADNVTINTSGGSNNSYIQYVTIGSGVNNITIQPTRNTTYKQVWYKSGRIENAV